MKLISFYTKRIIHKNTRIGRLPAFCFWSNRRLKAFQFNVLFYETFIFFALFLFSFLWGKDNFKEVKAISNVYYVDFELKSVLCSSKFLNGKNCFCRENNFKLHFHFQIKLINYNYKIFSKTRKIPVYCVILNYAIKITCLIFYFI